MVTRVLLITGARSLATRPGAEAWARGHIAEALQGCDLLIVGDADGPDAWAADVARTVRTQVDEYLTRGRCAGWITGRHNWIAVRPWTDAAPPRDVAGGNDREEWRRWLLSRNAAMVRDIAAMRAEDHDVTVLALLDGLKVDVPARDGKPGQRATRGTEHTVGLARAAGLTVREEVWRG